MSQTYQSRTPNHSDHKTAAVLPMPLTLSGAQARALWEMCTLATYHPSGFTYTREMEAVCELIADAAGSATDRAFCLARSDQRERAAIAAYTRKHAA
jgi:hypothetical protein